MTRHVLTSAAALVPGLGIGLIADSAVGAGAATLVFGCVFTLLAERSRNG